MNYYKLDDRGKQARIGVTISYQAINSASKIDLFNYFGFVVFCIWQNAWSLVVLCMILTIGDFL